jgi:hypothetical protein
MAFEHERAQIQRRAVGENRPFACSGTLSAHKSAKETVKTIAQGNAGCSGEPVVTNARAFYTTRAAAGATGTRLSLRPPIFEAKEDAQLGRIASREGGRVSCRLLKFIRVIPGCAILAQARNPYAVWRCFGAEPGVMDSGLARFARAPE